MATKKKTDKIKSRKSKLKTRLKKTKYTNPDNKRRKLLRKGQKGGRRR